MAVELTYQGSCSFFFFNGLRPSDSRARNKGMMDSGAFDDQRGHGLECV